MKEFEKINKDQIDFLKHTLDVIKIGDAEMLNDHAGTIQLRINRLESAQEMIEILANQQSRINDRLKSLTGREVFQS